MPVMVSERDDVVILALNVWKFAAVRSPAAEALDVDMVKVCTPFAVAMLNPPVAPAVANVCVEEVEPFNEVRPVPEASAVQTIVPVALRVKT